MRRSHISHDPLRTWSQVGCAHLRARTRPRKHGHQIHGLKPPEFTGPIAASRSGIQRYVPALHACTAPSRYNPHSHHAVQFK
jgi:hypothetical protein